MGARYERKDFKTILNKMKFVDSWFWCRYTLNPYNGCEHACTYCDSRSHKYHLHPEFDQVIYVKNNAGEMLDKRISRARTLLPDVVSMSGTCDPYQPAEKEFENTRQCLEVLAKHGYPVNVCTKASLVTRDIELLNKIANKNWAAVTLTITTMDEKLSNFLEPDAPSPQDRLKTISELKKSRYVASGVNYMPIVPFLGDLDSQLEDVVRNSKEAGADYVVFAPGMTMRDRQAAWFFRRLGEEYPELVEKYLKLYDAILIDGEYKGKYASKRSYSKKINKKMFELCEKYDMKFRMPRFIPDDFRRENYIIAEDFLNEAYEQQARGKPYSNLYWAGANINNLKEPIRSIAAKSELKKIRNVDEQLEKRIRDYLDKLK